MNNQTASKWRQFIESPLTFLLLIFAVAAGYFTVIEWRVRSIVNDSSFVDEVASRTRPAIVFDTEGRTLANAGALQMLEGVPTVETISWGTVKITIKSKEWLASEPIVESLDLGNVSVKASRGSGNVWTVVVGPRDAPWISATGPKIEDPAPLRFRLEITRPR